MKATTKTTKRAHYEVEYGVDRVWYQFGTLMSLAEARRRVHEAVDTTPILRFRIVRVTTTTKREVVK